MKIIEIENSFLEELRCGLCENYLICFPIRVCTDGRIICGKCEPEGDKVFPPYQVPLLEKMVKKLKFSCKFKENGCDEELSVDFVNEHESKCVYRPCKCMYEDCNWVGLLVELESHFSDDDNEHSVCNKVEIRTNWEDEVDDLVLASIESIPILVEYKYCCDTGVLSYKISYISAYIQEASYTIYKDNEKLTGGELLSYYHSSNKELDVKDILDSLLTIKITLIKYSPVVVDFATLNFCCCVKCGKYLLPSAYDYQSSGYICELCAENTGPKIPLMQSIFTIVQNPRFPCKWKYCNFVSSVNIMHKHEKTCRFRIYKCSLKENCKSGNLAYITKHLKDEHNYYHFNKKESMKKNPNHETGTDRMRFTLKYGTLTTFLVGCTKNSVSVKFSTFGGCKNIPIYIEFIHEHCRISKRFCVFKDCYFTVDDLPPCFKGSEDFTAVVTVE